MMVPPMTTVRRRVIACSVRVLTRVPARFYRCPVARVQILVRAAGVLLLSRLASRQLGEAMPHLGDFWLKLWIRVLPQLHELRVVIDRLLRFTFCIVELSKSL